MVVVGGGPARKKGVVVSPGIAAQGDRAMWTRPPGHSSRVSAISNVAILAEEGGVVWWAWCPSP